MHPICFQICSSSTSDIAWEELLRNGVQILYSSENNEGHAEIHGILPSNLTLEKLLDLCPSILSAKETPLAAIDWDEQWSLYGLDYSDGCVHIDLAKLGCLADPSQKPPVIRLQSGPGFGNLSHPTTRLMLRMLAPHVCNQFVVDVGSGSGVLSLCAMALGASSVCGIDIDPEANSHAEMNAQLNGYAENCIFILPHRYDEVHGKELPPPIVLMNMIRTEQEIAWASLPKLHHNFSMIITSGILTEEREIYLKQCSAWDWHLLDEIEEEGWLCFRFQPK